MTDAFTASSTSRPRSPRTIAIDNLLRQALKVTDPHDPTQIANALLARYPEEAARTLGERSGLAHAGARAAAPPAAAGGASSAELMQARDDIERDLGAIATASELKDIRIEMIGWGRTIRQIAADGFAAARLALDPLNHNRALAARRGLGEYARLARYLGALNAAGCTAFRRLAQSCDTLAALILVAIGEGLAASGITRSTSIVRVAAGELQSRRNAVLNALRGLTGSVGASLGQEDWPRGLEAYRNLVGRLDADGQADLRALLDEAALGQAMDELVDLATGASADSLRELSTASALLVHRFQRLVYYGQVVEVPADAAVIDGPPESPPLTAFISAVQLFVDAFSGMGGGRLLYLARPPIVIYGLYGAGGPDAGALRLVDLATQRGRLAEQIDCLACCGCDAQAAQALVLLDYLLFSLDRAIDLYAVGTDPDGIGDPERRAAAAGRLVRLALDEDAILDNIPDALEQVLEAIEKALVDPFGEEQAPQNAGWAVTEERAQRLVLRELEILHQSELQTERLVRSLSPICHVDAIFNYGAGPSLIRTILRQAIIAGEGDVDPPAPVQIPAPVASALATIAQDRPDFWAVNEP